MRSRLLEELSFSTFATAGSHVLLLTVFRKQSPEPDCHVVSSSDGSIVNNAGDDWTSSGPHPIERPLSTGAIPDTHRFKDLTLQDCPPPLKSRKRRAPEPPKGGVEDRDVHPKRETTDPDFDRGHLHRGSLFEPAADDGKRFRPPNDHGAATGTVTKWSDPRNVSSVPSPQRPGGNSPPKILKKSSSGKSQYINGHIQSTGSDQNQPPEDPDASKWRIRLQPETRAISDEQLVKEVRGIYAGLLMVEKKCNEIDQQQARVVRKHVEEGGELEKLKKEQWQALIAMHRTLLHEHHDFFLATQHPSASPSLKNLPQKYSMPARMWKHGIHSFLEILRQRLPDSLEHMLSFIYLSYSMMTLLVESVPIFEDTWIECLGDLARYRMAVEEANVQNREVWAGVARYWYNKGADRNPAVGRIQHHLAVLSRSNILQQLFFYTKSLICVQPFSNTTDSIRQLFNSAHQLELHRLHPIMASFTNVHRLLFTRGSVQSFVDSVDTFLPYLSNQIGRVGVKWREEGVYIASTNSAAILGYGSSENTILSLLREALDEKEVLPLQQRAQEHWSSTSESEASQESKAPPDDSSLTSVDIVPFASRFAFYTLDSVMQHVGDKNVIPYVHVSLAFLWSMALVPDCFSQVESDVPWEAIVRFLNTLPRQGTNESRIQSDGFPSLGIILPEDYLLRGQIWSEFYYPEKFFDNSLLDIDERPLELPSIAVPRVERCLWLGARIATVRKN